VAERHLGLQVNYSFAEVTPETLAGLVREVAQERPDAITTFCTNLAAAQLAGALVRALDTPIHDSVATVVWKALATIGADTRPLASWGRMFAEAT
jgi:maleate isomerase